MTNVEKKDLWGDMVTAFKVMQFAFYKFYDDYFDINGPIVANVERDRHRIKMLADIENDYLAKTKELMTRLAQEEAYAC